MDDQLRPAMFAHLRRLSTLHPDGIASSEINDFVFAGRRLPLIVQPGIWKPRGLTAALTIRTTYTGGGRVAPYEDEIGADGMLRYKWRGEDPRHSDNRALREAMTAQRPMAYFVGVARGIYHAIFPAYLVFEEPELRQFAVAVDEGQRALSPVPPAVPAGGVAGVRSYAERLTRLRLHQPVFRARVLRAYDSRCAMCRLRHPELLDAAHILADTHPRGEPVVPNGLALCKIHHAAFDCDILGVRPDLVVEVRADVLAEVDGPMLQYGLQQMHGAVLAVPNGRADRPDRERLEERYETFRRAA
jgi:putative restriction endonuclease